jgi:5'-3' exonuclease
MIFLTILREYFDVEYNKIKDQMKHLEYSISKIIKDFVFLFFFIGNDFLPRCMAYNIRERSIEKLIAALKTFLIDAEDYVVGDKEINIK